MAYADLREYIAALTAIGEVQPISVEVDWNLEVGAIIRRSYDLKAPAPLFQNIRGYPNGYRIFGAPVGISRQQGRTFARLAMSLGLPPEATPQEIMDYFIERRKIHLKPEISNTGPCKEKILVGEAVNLLEFPAPLIHDGDGGRYLGTWHLVATRDPENGWVNWGMYRLMIHDRNTLGVLFGSTQHGYLHYRRREAMQQPMEVAIALGTEPVTPIVCGLRVPWGVEEAQIIGGLRGEPLKLVPCETVNLHVPATSEIVIEGTILPGERREEGPFGEYTGYRAGDRAPRPVCHITAITHRHDPILPVTCMGVPVDDYGALHPLIMAGLYDDLRSRGFPVKMVYSPLAATPHLICISTRVPYPHYVKDLAAAVWSSPHIRYVFHLFIFDEDIDVTNIDEVLWAFSTRCHPDRGISKVTPAPGQPLVPFLSKAEKANLTAASVLFDCTWPKDWAPEDIPEKASFDLMWPPHLQEQVQRRWTQYGYPPEEG